VSAESKPDVQAGADAVVAIVESLAQAERYDGIVAILRSYRPCDHPAEVSIALLLTAGKDEVIFKSRAWLDAVNRFAAHRAAYDGVAPAETMRLLGGGS
jgi:hypothetical protein